MYICIYQTFTKYPIKMIKQTKQNRIKAFTNAVANLLKVKTNREFC